jgi:hypothetical protein
VNHRLRLRVNRVEYWSTPYSRDGRMFTQVEVQTFDGGREAADPKLVIESHGYVDVATVPTRMVLNFAGKITDYEPGDLIAVTLTKTALEDGEADPDEIPF